MSISNFEEICTTGKGTIRNYITMILDKTNLEHRTAIAVNYLKGNL